MKTKYVPILKCKMGEQKALKQLSDDVKDLILPLIEIPYSPSMTKKDTQEIINSFWPNRTCLLYFMSDWFYDYENINLFFKEKFTSLCSDKHIIPVLDLSLIESIDCWSSINPNGIAIRLRNNEFGQIDDILNPLFNNHSLERNNVHLIFDLQYINGDDLFSKSAVLKAAFSDLEKPNEFKSIIISSVSFPKNLPTMESKQIYTFKRYEIDIHTISLKLSSKFDFNYYYSDYGPSDIDDSPFVIGMSPNFKIKYTAFEDYVYIKGIQIKKGGLDLANVIELSKILVNSKHFSGDFFSWGDNCIYKIANNISQSSGNLTTWVGYSLNHHISFITNQI